MFFLFAIAKPGSAPDVLNQVSAQAAQNGLQLTEGVGWAMMHQPSQGPAYLRQNAGVLAWHMGYAWHRQHPSWGTDEWCSTLLDGPWPLDEGWSGSFGTFAWRESDRKLALANDFIGFYPLMVGQTDELMVVSSSEIWAGRVLGTGIDHAGAAERMIGNDYCNFGRRTIVEGLERIAPGERLLFDLGTWPARRESALDTRLFRDIREETLKQAADRTWQAIEAEFEAALKNDSTIHVAMSGGMDSRIMLGAIPQGKQIIGQTYGSAEYTEVQIARKCIMTRPGAEFHNYPTEELCLPPRQIMENHVHSTESVTIATWASLIEGTTDSLGQPILLGDMTEAIPGRNIQTVTSRAARKKLFLKTLLSPNQFQFHNASPAAFERWKAKILKSIREKLLRLHPALAGPSLETHWPKIEADLQEMFGWVDAYQLPYAELYDELFQWFLHARLPMGRQVLLCNKHFRGLSPIMGMGILQATSTVHPKYRVNYRLMDAIFRQQPALRLLSKLPTAQVPMLPYSAPNYLKLFAWGVRSTLDQRMTARRMKAKNPELRGRTYPHIDYLKTYRMQGAADNVRSYFSGEYLDAEHFAEKASSRATMDTWPYAPTDLINSAALDITIHAIRHPELRLNLD